jgi:hypothetical protein
MKPLISLFLFLSLISPTFAVNIPISIDDANMMVTLKRWNGYTAQNQQCKSNIILAKAVAGTYYNSAMSLVEKWKVETESTRALTTAEMREYTAVKAVFTLEKTKPDFTTWSSCDEVFNSFIKNIDAQLPLYRAINEVVRSEYPTAILAVVSPKVKSYTSISTGKQVAVVNKKDMTSQANVLAQYDTIVSLMTNSTGKVVRYTVLIKNDIVNSNSLSLYGANNAVDINSMNLNKLYNSYWPVRDTDAIKYSDPVKGYPTSIKVGSIYYTGK